MQERTIDRTVWVLACSYSLFLWWPTRELPYHWDAADFVVGSARDLLRTHFSPLVVGHSDFAHPPLLVAALAVVWRVFGETRLVSHLFMLPFLPMLLLGTYAIGKRIGNPWVGAASAAVVATVPVVVAEYGQIYVDLPVGALMACAVAAWLGERRLWAALLFCAAAAIKEAPLVVPACLALLLAFDRARRTDARRWAALAAPFAVYAVWTLYHHAAVGWWFTRPGFAPPPRSLSGMEGVASLVAGELLVEQWRWVLVALAIGSLALLFRRRRDALHPVAAAVGPLALPVVGSIVFFGGVGIFGMRYAIFCLPLLAVVVMRLVWEAMPRPWLFAIAASLAFLPPITTWHPKRTLTEGYEFRPEDDLGYLDLIAVGRDAARWVEERRNEPQVFGAFPESYQLTEPWQGYVTRTIEFAPCTSFTRDASRSQLVYVHAYSPGQMACKSLVDGAGARPIKRFIQNGKWIEIWSWPRPK